MAKYFIIESERMQKLAGINEARITPVKMVTDKIYVVDKKENDNWLATDNRSYTFRNRPWAKSFDDLKSAAEYANTMSKEVEIELPDGIVLGKNNGKWVEVFT